MGEQQRKEELNMNQASRKTQDMVKLALFSGIIVVLSLTPLGYIPLGVIKATTIHIPVILGSILLGWKSGAVLGGLFGLTSFMVNTITPNLTSFVFTPFYSLGDAHGNFWSLVICFVPRILVGVVPYFVYQGIRKLSKRDSIALGIAGFIGSMVNTILVMNLIYVFFGESWGSAKGVAADMIYKTILAVIATNGIPEAIVAALITTAVGKVLLIGGFENDSIEFTARVATDVRRTEEQYAVEIHQILHLYGYSAKEMEGSIISSVVPPLTSVMKMALRTITGKKPLVVGPGLKTGLNIKLDNPTSLGADRVADTVAAIHDYQLPLMVVDMGTATTMSVINEKEEFIGGAIMPGLRLSLEALSSKASLLPHIDLIPPKSVIAKNTTDAMDSGMIYGTASMIDGMIDRIQEEMGRELAVVATGGLAKNVVPYCKHKITHDPNLLLKGLRVLYYKNMK